MPAKSKAQQRFFGMVDAYKKGELKNPSKAIKKAAKGMTKKEVKDFAETKHKGLPEKVEEQNTVKMNNKIVRMTEEDLHRIIRESVEMVLNENCPEEGWLGDKFNQAKSAAKTAFSGGDQGIKQRFQNAKKNWGTQGELNGINNLRQQLMQLINDRKIKPETTVGQLLGGQYNNNKFGTIDAMSANRRGQINRRGGQAY